MLEHRYGRGRISRFGQIDPKVQVGLKPVGGQFHSFLVCGDCFLRFSQMTLRKAQIKPGLRILGLRDHDRLQFLFSLGVLLCLQQDLSGL